MPYAEAVKVYFGEIGRVGFVAAGRHHDEAHFHDSMVHQDHVLLELHLDDPPLEGLAAEDYAEHYSHRSRAVESEAAVLIDLAEQATEDGMPVARSSVELERFPKNLNGQEQKALSRRTLPFWEAGPEAFAQKFLRKAAQA